MIYSFNNKCPTIHKNTFIAPSADIIGDVTIDKGSSIWFNCSVRGDGNYIKIGKYTNIQDNTVVHIATNTSPTIIGDYITIGHNAIIHACTLKNYSFIGMGSIILDGSIIEPYGFVAAGAVVPPNFIVPEKTLVAGVPAKIIRKITINETQMIEQRAKEYFENSQQYLNSLRYIPPNL